MESLHHFPREILEEFDLVGAIAKKFGPVPWNPHVWAYVQANTVATLVTCVPLDSHRSVCVPDNVKPGHFSQLHLKMLQEKSLRESSRSSSIQLVNTLAAVLNHAIVLLLGVCLRCTIRYSLCFLLDAVDDVGFCRMIHLLISIRQRRRERMGFVYEERIHITIITTAFGSRNIQLAEE